MSDTWTTPVDRYVNVHQNRIFSNHFESPHEDTEPLKMEETVSGTMDNNATLTLLVAYEGLIAQSCHESFKLYVYTCIWTSCRYPSDSPHCSRIWGSRSGSYEEFCLLGYNAVQSVESQSVLRRNMSPPSSGSKNNPSKKPSWKQVVSRALLATCHRNVGWLSTDSKALYPRRQNTTYTAMMNLDLKSEKALCLTFIGALLKTNSGICGRRGSCVRKIVRKHFFEQAFLLMKLYQCTERSSLIWNSHFYHSTDALCYKTEGRGFKFRWSHWIFFQLT
jgi:hypothetical protein